MTDIANPLTCPVCGNALVITRTLPMELVDATGMARRRIPQAQTHTCRICGASWYPEGTEQLPSVPVSETPPAPPTADVYC